MDNNFTAPAVSVTPDKTERKQIRAHYAKVALVIFVNMFIFNMLGTVGSYLLPAELFESELFCALFSYGIPVISEAVSIILGIRLLGLNFKPMMTREGYDGGTVMKLIFLSLGLQTAASLLASLIAMILEMFGLESRTANLESTDSLSANIIMYTYACLIGPVLEELLYRGVLLQSMRKYNERFAIFLSALIFGLMHQNYQQFILGFLVGIPLAVVTIKHGSLLPSVFTHILMNTTSMFFSCWIQYSWPELYNMAASGDMTYDIFSISTGGIISVLCSGIFRIAVTAAGLVIGIICLVKGGNMSRPTPAGRSRSLPIFATCAPWWIVLALYLFLCFVYPFIRW